MLPLKDSYAKRPSTSTVEAAFGRFRYVNDPDRPGAILIRDAAWTKANIIGIPTKELPGWPITPGRGSRVPTVWVHRMLEAPLRAVWADLVKANLTRHLRTFDGCWVPRHQLWIPSNPLSIHSWAAALDFDAAWNGYGAVPRLHPEVVKVFEQWGFVWGGRWKPYDGMHFQWTDPVPGQVVPPWQDEKVKKEVKK